MQSLRIRMKEILELLTKGAATAEEGPTLAVA